MNYFQSIFKCISYFGVILFVLLTACSSSPDTSPQAVQPTGAIIAVPTSPQTVPTLAANEDGLPGRMLFVQNGTVWLWQGAGASPLFGNGTAWQPRWSPDGTKIAYVQRDNSFSDIVVADSTGQQIAQLTANGSTQPPNSINRVYDTIWSLYPAWSPDGTEIAMASQYGPPFGDPPVDYNLSLFTLPSVGGQRTQVFADPAGHCGRIAYTADGRTLAFTYETTGEDGKQQVYTFDTVTGSFARFPSIPDRSYDPAFSPDGRWLAFTAQDDQRTDVFVLPADTSPDGASTPQRLTSLGVARAPVFSPDGRYLAFLALSPDKGGFELWVADIQVDASDTLRAENARQLTFDMRLDADSGLSWTP